MKNLRFKANTFHLFKHDLFLAGLEFGLATQLLEQEAALRYIQTLFMDLQCHIFEKTYVYRNFSYTNRYPYLKYHIVEIKPKSCKFVP